MEQIEAFWNGVLIGERKEGEFTIECRQIDGFCVEYKKDKHYVDMCAFKNPGEGKFFSTNAKILSIC